MDITVTFRHMEPTESLRTYAEEKVSKINKYLDYPVEAHIVLTVEKFRHVADVTLSLNGTMVKGVEETEDMYSAIDQVMDKIERQTKKYKDKLTSHKDHHRSARHNIFSPEDFTEVRDSSLIKSESIEIKSMRADEAVLELGASDDDFYVFKNTETDKVNVMYRRRNGDFGLIEPENS